MSQISILIVDDDLPKITSIITTIKDVVNDSLHIKQASCVQEAVEVLQNDQFHLLITDLNMPLKYDDQSNVNGGQSLLRSIYKISNKLNVPMYIVGLTQFPALGQQYKGVWKIWHYDSTSEDWKINLRDLIFHITLVKSRINSEKIETVFVEGPSDKILLRTGLNFFFNNLSHQINIETIKYGGGASWVERQLFIWSKSLSKRNGQEGYLKSIGLFDDDEAGRKSIINLRHTINCDSAESKTFSVVKAGYQFSPILKSIKSKGISFDTTIEDLLSISCWKIAIKRGWTENRNPSELVINANSIDSGESIINNHFLDENKFTEEELLLISNKIIVKHKLAFIQLACSNEFIRDQDSTKFILEEVINKLKLTLKAID